jgi:DNA-binding response OmpR family regulator
MTRGKIAIQVIAGGVTYGTDTTLHLKAVQVLTTMMARSPEWCSVDYLIRCLWPGTMDVYDKHAQLRHYILQLRDIGIDIEMQRAKKSSFGSYRIPKGRRNGVAVDEPRRCYEHHFS